MNKTECLDPAFSLQDFGTFSGCFMTWGDSPNAPIVHVSTNNSFGRVISTCINAYCQLPRVERADCCALSNSTEEYLSLSTVHNVDFHSEYCVDSDLVVNPDVAGPGVCFSFP